MSVVAIGEYPLRVLDSHDKFHGAQLLYVGWDKHLMFCAPLAFCLPPTTRFGDLMETILPGAYAAHPDTARIDWSKATWLKSGQPWTPDPAKTLAENGLKHKDCLRFQTPGLNGIKGSCS